MTNRAMYFIDLDGTLLNQNHYPSLHNQKSIWEAHQYVDITIATGRNYTKLIKNLGHLLNIGNFICMNGALIIVDNEIFAHYPLALSEQEKILQALKKRRGIYYLFNRFNVHTNWAQNCFSFAFWAPRLLKKKLMNTYKISLFHFSKKRAWANFTYLKSLNLNVQLTLSFKNHSIEITDPSASKGQAAAFLMHKKNSDGKNSIHIGDSLNDLSMKGVVGKLVALDNATPNLKKEADLVGPHYKDDGVAQVLEIFLFDYKTLKTIKQNKP